MITVLSKEHGFFLKCLIIYIRSIRDQFIADAGNSNITRPQLLKPVACEEFVFWIGDGDREERKKERNKLRPG